MRKYSADVVSEADTRDTRSLQSFLYMSRAQFDDKKMLLLGSARNEEERWSKSP